MMFSHDEIRKGQKELVELIITALKEKKNVIAHAPTGLGKTAAALCPALDLALNQDLFVVFLTARHTQHRIVLSTLRQLKEKHDLNFNCVSIIGKKWMCAQQYTETMPSGDFAEYCKNLVEKSTCEFFTNAKSKVKSKSLLKELNILGPLSAEEVIEHAKEDKMCPYEISMLLAGDSKVVIADYYYIFNPRIRELFLNKIGKSLEQAIIIVDEAHNLPNRIRELMTSRLSTKIIGWARKEANKFNLELPVLEQLEHNLISLGKKLNDEKLIQTDDLLLDFEDPVEDIITEFELASDTVHSSQKRSFIGSVAKFLENWIQEGEGFTRTLTRSDDSIVASVICLDPANLTADVFSQCYSSILMSGTLSPVTMYRDLLGVSKPTAKVFPSPFPEENRLCLIVPKTTTKYSMRTDQQFSNIAETCADLANSIPGCVMLFFPSYYIRDRISQIFIEQYKRTVFQEFSGMTKADKQELLDRFADYKHSGAALLAVASGSFGEGIDLPGVLKGVIVAGLPLDRPSLETKELIAYYDLKYGKGWDYGYILPAMTKCIQNAGRCIRSETDKGAIIFVDERYAWPRYKNCFPPEWKPIISKDYKEKINKFFTSH
jgi:DNA excision repair protein ERCC-2